MTPRPKTCEECKTVELTPAPNAINGRFAVELCLRHASAELLYEAAKKALTCASLNSDVRALLVAAIKAYEGK
jgi:hypothetical protein